MEPTLECDLHRGIHSLLSRTSTSVPNNILFLRYTYETINEWKAWGDLSEVSHFYCSEAYARWLTEFLGQLG